MKSGRTDIQEDESHKMLALFSTESIWDPKDGSGPYHVSRTGPVLLSFCSCPSFLLMNGAEKGFGGEHVAGSLLQQAPFGEEKGGHWQLAVKIRLCMYCHDIAVTQRKDSCCTKNSCFQPYRKFFEVSTFSVT